MQAKSLMKRSAFKSRRKILIYILTTVLILGIASGFTDPLITDNTRHIAGFGETIVMEKETPTSGTPSDYDLISNLSYAAYKLHHASYFKGVSSGKSVADLGISSYTQNISGTRVATSDGVVFSELISYSSLKSVAEQKYADNGIIIFRPSVSISGGTAKFADTAYAMSYEDYSASYGTVPNQLSKYVVTEETIVDVKDLNAAEPVSNGVRTSDGGDGAGFDFYVPETLTRGEDGNYLFELTLAPDKSAIYYRNEVRTLAGADNNPAFHSVKLIVCIDDKWTPQYVTAVENYDVAIPVLGAMNCTSTVTEVFSDVGDETCTVPERDFFAPYVEQAKLDGFTPPDIPQATASPADYLATAFADYLNGEKNLELTADIKNEHLSAHNARISVNIKDMDIRAILGSLYFRYAGDRIDVKCNDVNGYINVKDIAALKDDSDVAALISAFGDLGELDLTALFGGDMLGRVFENCEMTSENGVTRIRMPFALDLDALDARLGKANIDASIYIKDEDKSLISITGAVEILSQTIKIDASPMTKPFKAPDVSNAVDLKSVIDFVPDIIRTATSKTFNVSGDITAQGLTFGIDGYIDITDGITADAVVTAFGADIDVKYVNDIIYIGIGNIDARGTADDLPLLLDSVRKISGLDLSSVLDILKTALPTSVGEYVNMLSSLTATDSELELGLKFLTAPINIKLTRADGRLSGVKFGVDFDKFGIKLNAAADLSLAYPEPRTVEVPTRAEYITFDQLAPVIENAAPYIEAKGFDVTFAGNIAGYAASGAVSADLSNGIAASGEITALGQTANFTFANNVGYFALANLKFKGDGAGLAALKVPALGLIADIFGVLPDMSDVDKDELIGSAIDAVQSLTIDENGIIYLSVGVDGDVTVVLSIDLASGKVAAEGTAKGKKISITANITPIAEAREIAAPTNAEEYIDIGTFAQTIESARAVISAKAIVSDFSVSACGNVYPAALALSFADKTIKASINIPDFGATVTLIGDKVYITAGKIRISGGIADINSLLAALDGVIPAEVKTVISSVLGGGAFDIEKTTDAALSAVGSLSVVDDKLIAAINAGSVALDLSLALDLSEISIATSVNGERVTVTLGNIAPTAGLDIPLPIGEFTQASEIIKIIPAALEYANASAYSAEYSATVTVDKTLADGQRPASDDETEKENKPIVIDGKANIVRTNAGAAVSADVNALGQTAHITFVNDTAFVKLASLAFKLGINDITALHPAVMRLVAAFGVNTDFALPFDIKDAVGTVKYALSAVKAFDVSNGLVSLTVAVYGNLFTVTLDPTTGELSVAGNALGAAITLDATVKTATESATITAPQGNFIDIASLDVTIDKVTDIVKAKGVTAKATVAVGQTSIPASIELSFADTLKAKITATVDALNDPLELELIDDTVYITLGDVRVSGNKTDIPALTEAAGGVLDGQTKAMLDELLALMNGDTETLIDTALKAVALSQNGNTLIVNAAYNGVTARVELPTDLGSAKIVASMNDTVINMSLTDIAPNGEIEIADPVGEFAQISELVKSAKPLLPLVLDVVKSKAVSISLDGVLSGYTLSTVVGEDGETTTKKIDASSPITGSVYLNFAGGLKGLQAEISLSIGDVPVQINIKGGKLYVDIANGVKVYETLSLDELKSVLHELDVINADISKTVLDIVDALMNATIGSVMSSLTLSPAGNGWTVVISEIAPNVPDITITATNGESKLDGISISIPTEESTTTITLAAEYGEDGAFTGFGMTENSATVSLGMGLSSAVAANVAVDESGYIPVKKLTQFIAPIFDLIGKAKLSESLSISGLRADIVLPNGKTTAVTGDINVSFEPLALSAKLVLFKDTYERDEKGNFVLNEKGEKISLETALDLTYIDANKTMFISTGSFKLSFDIATDAARIYDVLAEHINPNNYLMVALKDMIDGNGIAALGNITSLINAFKSVATAENAKHAIGLLLGKTSGDSAIKTALGMVNVFDNDGALAVGVSALGVTLNVTPRLADNKLAGATVTTNLFGASIRIEAYSYALSETAVAITAPTEGYISIAEFIEAVNNAVNTFTTRAENGDITVDVKDFDFDYDIFAIAKDENGNELKDNSGRLLPLTRTDENGKKTKVVAQHISVGKNGDYPSILKINFKKAADGSHKLNFEAHIKLDIIDYDPANDYKTAIASSTLPIALDVYVVNDEKYKDDPIAKDGLAFVDYAESNGAGERLSIDYTSVLQIAASAMKILGVDDALITQLLGEGYVQSIDTTVFKSMDIAGLKTISSLIEKATIAGGNIKDALTEIKSAWSIVENAESTDNLKAELDKSDKVDGSIKKHINTAIELIKSAKETMTAKVEEEPTEPVQPTEPTEPVEPVAESNEVNGKLFKDIVEGITLGNVLSADGSHKILSAHVDNKRITQTEDFADVIASMTNKPKIDGVSVKNTVDEITVKNLDVNTAKLNNFYLPFSAGETVEINLPDKYTENTDKSTYSNLANIKHLLYDVMNTAGMLEFEIGDINKADSNNQISMVITTGAYNVNLNIKYNAKIEIIDQGEGADPRYKTAAVIELNHDQVKGQVLAFIPAGIIMPKCTTRLYFYDNVIYIRGVKSWKESWGSVKNMEYIDACYTTIELSNKLSEPNGIVSFMNEFVYYLLPLSNTVKDTINKAIEAETSDKYRTPAQVFKGYKYTVDDSGTGTHGLVIGLKELAGINVLSDANISIIGKNDANDNILDNYVNKLHVDTNVIGGMVKLNINGTLLNVSEYSENGVARIKSGGLSNTIEGETLMHVINTRIPGTTWSRIWA